MLSGILTEEGTFTIHGEENTGVVVSIPRETLRDAVRIPLYRPVVIIEEEEYLRILARLYALAYRHGHEDTAEANYTDVHHTDYDIHFLDNVKQAIIDESLPGKHALKL